VNGSPGSTCQGEQAAGRSLGASERCAARDRLGGRLRRGLHDVWAYDAEVLLPVAFAVSERRQPTDAQSARRNEQLEADIRKFRGLARASLRVAASSREDPVARRSLRWQALIELTVHTTSWGRLWWTARGDAGRLQRCSETVPAASLRGAIDTFGSGGRAVFHAGAARSPGDAPTPKCWLPAPPPPNEHFRQTGVRTA
jgi:hypothetical protein